MRDYAKIYTALWRSRKFRALPNDDARLLYLYLHTCPHSNMLGCFVLDERYAAADLGWTAERFRKGIDTVSKASLIGFDRAESLVRIVDFIRHDPFCNPKHAIAAVKLARKLPDSVEKQRLMQDLARAKYVKKEDLGDTVCDTVSIHPEPEPEPKKERDKSLSRSDEGFDEFWAAVPRKVAKGAALKAYRAALKKADAETILAGMKRYAAVRAGQDHEFTAHPATWLNAGRWDDEAATPAKSKLADLDRGTRRVNAKGETVEWEGEYLGWVRVYE